MIRMKILNWVIVILFLAISLIFVMSAVFLNRHEEDTCLWLEERALGHTLEVLYCDG